MYQCGAITNKGKRCKRKISSGEYCFQHSSITDKSKKTEKMKKKKNIDFRPVYWIIRHEEYSRHCSMEDECETYDIVAKTESRSEKKKLLAKFAEGHQISPSQVYTFSVKQTKPAKYLVIIVDEVGQPTDDKNNVLFTMKKDPKSVGKGWKEVEDYDDLNTELPAEGLVPDDLSFFLYRGSGRKREYAIIKPLKVEEIDIKSE